MKSNLLPAGRTWWLLASYAPLHWLLLLPANVVWHPPAGLRFAWLVLLPMRWWLPAAIWLELFYRLNDAGGWRGVVPFLAHFAATCSGPWLFRRQVRGALEGTDSLCWLLVAMLVSATLNAVQIVAWPQAWASGLAAGELLPRVILGDYIGMLAIVPLALLALQERPNAWHRRKWRVDLPLVLMPLLALLGWILAGHTDTRSYLLAACLALPPAIYMAFRTGWRGVALLLSASSLVIGLNAWDAQDFPAILEGQFAFALTGSVLLLLGAATDTLRDHRYRLRRNNQELELLARELRAAARRNLDVSESVRRWVTSELHDELGQNLTALQTRLTLVERRTDNAEMLRPAWDIIAGMRNTVSSLMSTLRPASLDDFGLRKALEHGPIRKLVELGGLTCDIRVDDRAGRLDDTGDMLQTALYRIVQETATNTLRHADARNFGVRLRSRQDGVVTLFVFDDGNGLPEGPVKGGLGLQGIQDRVISLGGRLRLRSDASGTRLLARFTTRQEPAS
jgi:two-component system sensor histidine kinase UhpB